MNSNVFLVSAIKEITKEKLGFWNHENQLQEIDFFECRKNWVAHFNNSEFITFEGTQAAKIVLEENYCVGERDWFARKPYYQFYTTPKIRFEIHLKKRFFNRYWRQRSYPEFRKIEERLHEVGLRTFDLG